MINNCNRIKTQSRGEISKRILVVVGIFLFIVGLFVPSITAGSNGTVIPIFTENPIDVLIYVAIAFGAFVLFMLKFENAAGVLATTIGTYLIIIGIPAAFDGSLRLTFCIVVLGDICMIAGCLYQEPWYLEEKHMPDKTDSSSE